MILILFLTFSRPSAALFQAVFFQPSLQQIPKENCWGEINIKGGLKQSTVGSHNGGKRGRWGLVQRAGSPLALAAFLRAGSLKSSPPKPAQQSAIFRNFFFFFILFEAFFPLGVRGSGCAKLCSQPLCVKKQPFPREGHHLNGEGGGGRRRGHCPGRKQKSEEAMGLPSSTSEICCRN